jgi:mannose-6-phosphate isomerase-like protein (cupin superfamily)
MDLESIYAPFEEFRRSHRTGQHQTTVIRLDPGRAADGDWTSGSDSGQMVLVLEGEMVAEIGGDRKIVGKGETLMIADGAQFRLSNEGKEPVTAFAVPAPGVSYRSDRLDA